MTTPSIRNSISRPPLRRGFLLVPLALALAWLVFSPTAQADCKEGCDLSNGNTFLGNNALVSNTTGIDNTAIGEFALFKNTTGVFNTANGNTALYHNTTGSENTATGLNALTGNTIGSDNTATGISALVNNTTGSENTATGDSALGFNTTGNNNTATGGEALFNNTGDDNTANGFSALLSNTTGNFNTANGFDALVSNTTGGNNTATGVDALASNTTGSSNTANGAEALLDNTGSNNIGLGSNAGINLTTGKNNIDIGNAGVAGESNKIRIGTKGTQKNTFIAGIDGVTVARGVAVIIDTNGHLGTVTSSERFKDKIKPMDKASEAILALQPVTFRYKQELDPEGIPQFGLVAEEVEKVNPALVARDEQGKVYTVRYEAVNAMLLNEFLKEHRAFLKEQRKVEAQEATITQLKQDFQFRLAKQQKQIEALTTGLQKVSEQLELSKSSQTVLNNQ